MIKNGQDVLSIGVIELNKLTIEELYKYRDVICKLDEDEWKNSDDAGLKVIRRIIAEKKRQSAQQINLNTWAELCHENSVIHGFWTSGKRNIPEALMLIVSEVAEAMEAHRTDKPMDEELADIIIRVLDLCGGLSINIVQAIEEKMKYNKTRPVKHGKKY